MEFPMENKITIIEGPPPEFEEVNDGWALGLNDSPALFNIGVTNLRTFNGPALIERCNRAWRNQQTIHLEYRSPEGLEQEAPIMAARFVDLPDGQLLMLWVRLDEEEVELELGYDDDQSDSEDDDLDPPDFPT
jgi:hypothetical protein